MADSSKTVLLVGPDREENLPIRYLSSALEAAGHTAKLATFDTIEHLDDVVEMARGCDAVGLSITYQVRAREFLELARAIKERFQVPIIAGGHYASCAAEPLLEHHPELDIIVIHEGEQTLVELADGFEREALAAVAGIAYRENQQTIVRTSPRPMIEELDSLPWPDRRGRARLLAGVPTAYMMGSRGCVFRCDYCCITTLHRLAPGKKLRRRDPEAIGDEMAALYNERGVRQFVFHDDNFLVPDDDANHRRLDQLQRAWARRGMTDLGFTIKCRPGDASRSVLEHLKAMGLLRLFLGIESSSESGLRAIGRRQPVEAATRTLDACDGLGLSVQYSLMLFNPESTLLTIEQDIAFMRAHLHHAFNFCRTEIYAGTPLEARMREEGRAQGGYLARTYRFSDLWAGLMSEIALKLLGERCWSLDSLMERAIGTDHLSAVLEHFYDRTPESTVLRQEIAAWRLGVNSHLVDLLARLAKAVARAEGPADPELRAFVAELGDEELSMRTQLLARGAALQRALQDHVAACVGLPAAEPKPGRLARLARHAAAVVLALGVASCGGKDTKPDQGVYEAPPPPLDMTIDGPTQDQGVYEAPPPPLEAGPDLPVPDGSTGDAKQD